MSPSCCPEPEERVINEFEEESLETGDDIRPHKQCPWETEDNGQPFQTEDLVSILVEVVRLPGRAQLDMETQVPLLTHRACWVFILFGTAMANQEQTDHNASSAGHYRHATGDLRGRCENNNLVCVRYVAVEIGNDYAGDGEESNIY